MADTALYLGEFKFEEFEIPESIALGGGQTLVVHRFPGGARAIQAMGRDDAPIGWSGTFDGENALERARYLDLMRVQGKTHTLFFFDFIYRVLIQQFVFVVENFHRVNYTLDLEVQSDLTQPQTTFPAAGLDASITDDCKQALEIGEEIGDDPLSELLSTMDSAISSVSDFANAAQATINSVLAPVSAVIGRVNTLIGAVSNTINLVATVGGVLPNTPIARQAARLTGQLGALSQLPKLYNLRSVATRVQSNLNLINLGPNVRTVTVGGGTLFDVAAREFGDATCWSAIAKANNLTDPLISAVTELKIPINPAKNGGIFDA